MITKDNKYLIFSKHEINQILQTSLKTNDFLNCLFLEQNFVTTILYSDINKNILILDASQETKINEKLVSQNLCTVKGQHEGIQIMFEIENLTLKKYQNRDAIWCSFPKSILRLQRRDFFRIQENIGNKIDFEFGYNDEEYHASVKNISLGGIGFVSPIKLETETTLDYGILRFGSSKDFVRFDKLIIKHNFSREIKNGKTETITGAMFVGIAKNGEILLQKHISTIERERKKFED